MQNTYSYEQFQKLIEVLLSAKEELKNFDNQNSFASRCQLQLSYFYKIFFCFTDLTTEVVKSMFF